MVLAAIRRLRDFATDWLMWVALTTNMALAFSFSRFRFEADAITFRRSATRTVSRNHLPSAQLV